MSEELSRTIERGQWELTLELADRLRTLTRAHVAPLLLFDAIVLC